MTKRRNLLQRNKLESLTTKRLLAYKNSFLKVPEDAGPIGFEPTKWHKQNPEWKKHYALIKEILATRENV